MKSKKKTLPSTPKWAPVWLVDFVVWKHSVPVVCFLLSLPIFYGAAGAVAVEQCLLLMFLGVLILLLGVCNALVEYHRIGVDHNQYDPGVWNKEKRRNEK